MAKSNLMVRSTPHFKLQAKDGKNIQGINLRKQFGFDPEIIILERLITEKNTFVVRAMLPEDLAKEIEKQEAEEKVVLK